MALLSSRNRQVLLAVVLTITMVVSPVAGTVSATAVPDVVDESDFGSTALLTDAWGTAAGNTPTEESLSTTGGGSSGPAINEEYLINPDEPVSIYALSPFFIRPTNQDAASTKIRSVEATFEYKETEDLTGGVQWPLDKRTVEVYNTGTEVNFEYKDGLSKEFNPDTAQDYQFVAARLKHGASMPSSMGGVSTLLTDDANVESEVVKTYEDQNEILTDGTATFTPNSSGRYVVALVHVGDNGGDSSGPKGFVKEGSNLTATSDVTIIGADTLLAQEEPSTIDSDSKVIAGESTSVGVDASESLYAESEAVSHTVVLLNDSKLSEQEIHTTVNRNGTVKSVNSSIGTIERSSSVVDGTAPFGTEIGAGGYTGSTDVATVIEQFVDPSGEITTDEGNTLYAAVGTVIDDEDAVVDLNTTESFDPGTYTLVHVATVENSTRSATSTQSIDVIPTVDLSITGEDRPLVGDEVTYNVTDSDGNPVADAVVTVDGQTKRTDASGQVTVTFEEAGSFEVTVSKSDPDAEYRGDTLGVSVLKPASLSVTESILLDSEVYTHEPTTVTATVTNTGDVSGSKRVALKTADGEQLNQTEVNVTGGNQKSVTFSPSFDTPGDRTLTINGNMVGTLSVENATILEGFTVNRTGVQPGDSVAVNATVLNRYEDSPGEEMSVDLRIDGEKVDWKPVNVNGTDGSKDVSFTVQYENSTTKRISVNDLPAREVTWSQKVTDLDLEVIRDGDSSPKQFPASNAVTFNVTNASSGNPIDATVLVAGQAIATGDDGSAETTIDAAGHYTARAVKENTQAVAYSDGVAPIEVTDPLSITTNRTNGTHFGAVDVDPETDVSERPANTTETVSVTVTNDGGRAVDITSAKITGPDSDLFEFNASEATGTIEQDGDESQFEVTFAPTRIDRDVSATVRLETNTSRDPVRRIGLSGTANASQLSLSASSVSFDKTGNTATRTIFINNTGNSELRFTPSGLGDRFSAEVPEESSTPITVAPGSSQELHISFEPVGYTEQSDTLELSTNDPFRSTTTIGVSGTGLAGAIDASPGDGETLHLGNFSAGEHGTAQILVRNPGTEAIEVDPQLSDTAKNSGFAFFEDTGWTFTLDPGETRHVVVKYAYESATPEGSVELVTTDGDVDNPSISLSANKLVPELTVTSSSPSFGDVPVEAASTQSVTIENSGNGTLTVTPSINGTDSSRFALVGYTDGETLSVEPSESMTVPVRFMPKSDGNHSATLELNDTSDPDDGDESTEIALGGTGITSELKAEPSAADFGTIGGGATTTKTVTLNNSVDTKITGLDVSWSGDHSQFDIVSDVPATLEGDETADVQIRYEPAQLPPGAPAQHSGSVTVNGSGETGDVSTVISVSGTAKPPVADVSADALDFGYENASSPAKQTVTVSNDGPDGTKLEVNATIDDNADAFSISSGSSLTLGSGESETIAVEFPVGGDLGPKDATLGLSTDGEDGAEQTVALGGHSAAPDPVSLTEAVDFGDVEVGTESDSETIIITNDGGSPAEIDDVRLATGAQFTIVEENLGDTLVPGETKTITVTATPDETTGHVADTVEVVSNGTDVSVTVSAVATEPEATAEPDVDELSFDDTNVGSASTETVTVTNDGSATLVLEPPKVDSDAFSLSSDRVRLGPGQSKTYTVSFTPSEATGYDDELKISTNADGAVTYVLNGSGQDTDVQFGQPAVEFGQVGVGETEISDELVLANEGDANATIKSVKVTGADASAFSVTNLSTGTLVGNGDTTFNVTVTPQTARSLSATLEVTTADDETTTASLGATGVEPDIAVSTRDVTFDRTLLGTESTETITVENDGNAPLNVEPRSDLSVTNFRIADSFQSRLDGGSLTIQPAESVEIPVTYAPPVDAVTMAKQGIPDDASLTLSTNDSEDRTVGVSLTGTAKTPELETSHDSLQYGTIVVGENTTQSVTIRNDVSGTAGLNVTDVAVRGADTGAFNVEELSAENRTLAPGESTTVDVTLSPLTTGPKYATLNVFTNDTRQPATAVFLSNTNTYAQVVFGSVDLTYINPEPNDQPRVDVSRGVDANATLDAVSSQVDTTNDFTLEFDTQENGFGEAAEQSPKFESVGYVEADHPGITGDQFGQATLRFTVKKSALEALDTSPTNVTLYHYDAGNGSYEAVETTLVEERRSAYLYSASPTSFSTFSIGADQSNLTISGEDVSPTNVETDDSVTVTATIENTGSLKETTEVAIHANGNQKWSDTVTVSGESTETISESITFPSTGDYTITVSGSEIDSKTAGTVTVSSGNTGGNENTDDDDTSTGGGGGGVTDPTETSTETPTETETPTDTETSTERDVTTDTDTSDPATDTPSPTDTEAVGGAPGTDTTTDDSGPGFGVLAALGALLVVSLLLRRRTID